MTLQGFTSLPEQATVGGAPIDAFQADAFRRNDLLFEQVTQALLASPFVPNGMDGEPAEADIDARKFLNARSLVVGTPKVLAPKVPLIWFARERIVLNARIDAKGKGGAAGETGDFGGSGGGGGAACLMPFTTEVIVQGGAAATAVPAHETWKLSRALLFLPFLKGGAGGPAANGGAGGGVVCLCAPTIEIREGAEIDASGTDGAGGGGGGGLVILLARQLINVRTAGSVNVKVNGGGGGPAGGAGRVLALTFQ